jgi:hypothetical protein
MLGVRDAVQYLIRPDGYIAFRCAGRNSAAFEQYLGVGQFLRGRRLQAATIVGPSQGGRALPTERAIPLKRNSSVSQSASQTVTSAERGRNERFQLRRGRLASPVDLRADHAGAVQWHDHLPAACEGERLHSGKRRLCRAREVDSVDRPAVRDERATTSKWRR